MHKNHFASECRSIVCHNRTAEDPAKTEEPSGPLPIPVWYLFNPRCSTLHNTYEYFRLFKHLK